MYAIRRRLHRFLFGTAEGTYISRHVYIGENVRIAPNVVIVAHNHKKYEEGWEPWKPVIIGDWCWIGANAVVLPGVELGPYTVVGAGAVVTKSFTEGHCTIAGVPAVKISAGE